MLRAYRIFFVTFALRLDLDTFPKSAAKIQKECPMTLDNFQKNEKNLHFFVKNTDFHTFAVEKAVQITQNRYNFRPK